MLYNFLIFLGFLFYLPKIFQKTKKQKGYRYPFKERLGLTLPKLIETDKQVYWFHANSLGETKAALGLAQYIKEKESNSYIVFSSVTETGRELAKKSPIVNFSFTMPLDFSFTMKKLLKNIHPKALFIVETDFWYQLVKQAKKTDTKTFVISGKISEKSLNRYKKVPFFSKKLFSQIDYFCLQNEEYKNAFESLGIDPAKLQVTGNIKCVQNIRHYHIRELDGFRNILKIKPDHKIITIASTHDPEERLLLDSIDFTKYRVLIAPRHPERFDEIFEELSKDYPIKRLSKPSTITSDTPIVFIDGMGLVPMLYQISHLAIVGGSFVDKIGGHNVLEPLLFNTPTIFGPHMFGQKDLKESALQSCIAKQLSTKELPYAVDDLIGKSLEKPLCFQSVLEDTYEAIKKNL